MDRRIAFYLIFGFVIGILVPMAVAVAAEETDTEDAKPKGRIFYVRQTVGDDLNDGRSPETAWATIWQLGRELQAGDTAYVGPGLYREHIPIQNSGTADRRITLIADSTGEHTGDPPGIVMIAGSNPVDEKQFTAEPEPGVYKIASPDHHVLSVVEMDGDQYRYARARDTREHLIDGLTERETVVKLPASFWYDKENRVAYIHTSDGKPPTTHEIELIHRGNGISMYDKHYITIVGFHLRSMGDAGITFFTGSSHGIAINNTSYGSRQGVRVYAATNILVAHNILFRNDNCGVYLAKGSTDGLVVGNTMYENIKGFRWSSDSIRGLGVGNITFDNHERGISLENTDEIRLGSNIVVGNTVSQLLAQNSQFVSQDNCYDNSKPEQLIAEFDYFRRYGNLDDYQVAEHHDLGSREGACGKLPEKLDVRKIHAETLAYTEKARAKLRSKSGKSTGFGD